MFKTLDSAADGYWSGSGSDDFDGFRYTLEKYKKINSFLNSFSGFHASWKDEFRTVLDFALEMRVPSYSGRETIDILYKKGALNYCDLKGNDKILAAGILQSASDINLGGVALCLAKNPLEPLELAVAVATLYPKDAQLQDPHIHSTICEIIDKKPNFYYSSIIPDLFNILLKNPEHFENKRQIAFLEKLVAYQADLNEVYKWDNQGEPLLNRHGEKVSKTLLDVAYEQKAKTLIAFLRSHGAQTYAELDAAGLVPIDWEEAEYERVNREYEASLWEDSL